MPVAIAMMLLLTGTTAYAASTTLLHSFNGYGSVGGPGDGAFPTGGIVLQDGMLYGTASNLGLGGGSLFSLKTDGSSFALLHKFNGLDGSSPSALAIVGSKLYGTASAGGTASGGVLYQSNLDGSSIEVLHQFGSGADANAPTYALTVDGEFLYGTSAYGGTQSAGTVFQASLSGDISLLHNFGGPGILEPTQPRAGVVIDNGVLYGTTYFGGALGSGVVFRSDLDGSDFQVLHAFGAANNAANPGANLVVVDSTIFGTTQAGSALSEGTLFSMNLDGTGYQVLHVFAPVSAHDPLNGSSPGNLQYQNGELYGTTTLGGEFGHGTLFRIALDGSGYELLHSFAGGPLDGDSPSGPLVFSGSTIIGTTTYGGTSGFGTVYAVTVPEPSSLVMASIASLVIAATSRFRAVASLRKRCQEAK